MELSLNIAVSRRTLSTVLALSFGILIMVMYTLELPYTIFGSRSIDLVGRGEPLPLELFVDNCLNSPNVTSVTGRYTASADICNDISVCVAENDRIFSIRYNGSFQCMTFTMNVILDSIRANETSCIHHIADNRRTDTRNRTALEETSASIRDGSFSDRLVHAASAVSVRLQWQTYAAQDWNTAQLPVETFYVSRTLSQVMCTGRSSNNTSQQCLRDLDPNHVYNRSHSGPGKHQLLPRDYHLQMHILRNAAVDEVGKVITYNDIEVQPLGCSDSSHPASPVDYDDVDMYDEVFSIAHVWGNAYYHSMVEGMSRLANFIDFLQLNPHIVIHTTRNLPSIIRDLHMMLGLRNPTVSGPILARKLYLPPGEGCGWVRTLSVLSLTHKYRKLIRTYFPKAELCRDLIILIKRSQLRWLDQHDSIDALLREAAKRYNFDYVVFDDKHLPRVKETMRLFYRARLIVAPHGAGLSNLVFTAPGATVVEVNCHLSAMPNQCFYSLAQSLGHAYVGILAKPTRENYMESIHGCGPLSISMAHLEGVVNMVLNSVVKKDCG